MSSEISPREALSTARYQMWEETGLPYERSPPPFQFSITGYWDTLLALYEMTYEDATDTDN